MQLELKSAGCLLNSRKGACRRHREDDMEMASCFDEHAILVQSEKDFWHLEDLGVKIIPEKIEDKPKK